MKTENRFHNAIRTPRHRTSGVAGILAATSMLAASSLAALPEPLTLRVANAEALAGGQVVIVLRTYAPRPVGQGQVCLTAARSTAAATRAAAVDGPFASFDHAEVFSGGGDAAVTTSFDPVTQTLDVLFASPTASVNENDGPLAALYFNLDSGLAAGDTFTVQLDIDSALTGPGGEAIPLNLRPGKLTVRAPDAPLALEADGGKVHPGSGAVVEISTVEAFPVDEGEVAVHYDPAVVQGVPTVTTDPRYGAAELTVDTSTPGLVRVAIYSADGSLNTVPGAFLSIHLSTRPDVPLGTLSPVSLDEGLTHLDSAGSSYALAPVGGVIEFRFDPVIFVDGFECGSVIAWSG